MPNVSFSHDAIRGGDEDLRQQSARSGSGGSGYGLGNSLYDDQVMYAAASTGEGGHSEESQSVGDSGNRVFGEHGHVWRATPFRHHP